MFYEVVSSFCNQAEMSTEETTHCGNFTALPRDKCYPVFYTEWQKIFQDEHKDYVMEKVKDAGAYFLHVWNKIQDFDNETFSLTFESKSAYMHYARNHCPKVYQSIVKYFRNLHRIQISMLNFWCCASAWCEWNSS